MTRLLGGCKLHCMGSYLRVKICGLTDEADAAKAAELGADAIGLNFYKESPRYVTPSKAKSIICGLPAFVEPVGIVVSDESPVNSEIMLTGIRTIQVHWPHQGSYSVFPYWALGARWIPAFSASKKNLLKISDFLKKCRQMQGDVPGEDAASLAAWMKKPPQKGPGFPAAILVDAHVPGQFGGTGKTVPWELLADFQPEVPLILAGGLTPENVADAVRIVRPYAVDVASGVEKTPGRKDADKMKRFIENAREAAERL